MTDLHQHLEDYLMVRRALGFKLRRHGEVLPQLVDYLDAAGAATLTTELAISFAQLPQGVQPIEWAHRLSFVRGFAKYLQTINPATEVPARDVFGARQQRPTPLLWQEEELLRLMEAATELRPALRGLTYEALFGLLWCSGLRIGEAIGLERDDVDLTAGVLTIREGKFRRSRLVPLQQSASDALGSYAASRDRICPRPKSRTFFVSSLGTALLRRVVERTFDEMMTRIGLRSEERKPRIHDIRHSFAVRTLISWYRSGAEVDARLSSLAAYLGHVDIASTYWYLSASPELIEVIGARLGGIGGGR
jgi:site-specific recombinase XerD